MYICVFKAFSCIFIVFVKDKIKSIVKSHSHDGYNKVTWDLCLGVWTWLSVWKKRQFPLVSPTHLIVSDDRQTKLSHVPSLYSLFLSISLPHLGAAVNKNNYFESHKWNPQVKWTPRFYVTGLGLPTSLCTEFMCMYGRGLKDALNLVTVLVYGASFTLIRKTI